MAVFAVAAAMGDIIKFQSFVYGSFVWGIHMRYNKKNIHFSSVTYVVDTQKNRLNETVQSSFEHQKRLLKLMG